MEEVKIDGEWYVVRDRDTRRVYISRAQTSNYRKFIAKRSMCGLVLPKEFLVRSLGNFSSGMSKSFIYPDQGILYFVTENIVVCVTILPTASGVKDKGILSLVSIEDFDEPMDADHWECEEFSGVALVEDVAEYVSDRFIDFIFCQYLQRALHPGATIPDRKYFVANANGLMESRRYARVARELVALARTRSLKNVSWNDEVLQVFCTPLRQLMLKLKSLHP